GVRVRYVIETHVHADHISAGRELAKAAGAEYVLFAEAKAAFPFLGVRDGEVLELGNVAIRVLHTPGHTPEHISLLVTDRTRAEEPWFVLTGHTLMVGDLGRTELATSAEEGACLVPQRKEPQGPAGLSRNPAWGLFRVGLRAQLKRQTDLHDRV